ncbi:hypothetical protein [Ruegeria lacuscaerulensis]|uniref:hypothetical protein n=1 Tax=Ruegeria lacuscaerulensis TaxID=55218 RepID=UPI00148107ED|nr:hypothetical protein [Ruegeria lacuscaerulensis]
MGKKNYSGGGTVLNSEIGFTTHDPAEKQKRIYLRSEPVYTPVRPSNTYSLQVQEQLRILLRKIANGKKKPHIPLMFKEEVSEYGSLLKWAQSKQEFEQILSERRRASKTETSVEGKRSDKTKPPKKRAKKAKKNKGGKHVSNPSVSFRGTKDELLQPGQPKKVSKHAAAAKRLGVTEAELIKRINALRAASKA